MGGRGVGVEGLGAFPYDLHFIHQLILDFSVKSVSLLDDDGFIRFHSGSGRKGSNLEQPVNLSRSSETSN